MTNKIFFIITFFIFSSAMAAEPYTYKDTEGDDVTVLDHANRLNSSLPKVGTSNVFDSDKKLNLTQQALNRNLALAHLKKYGVYTVVDGDTFEKISEKLYGKTTRSDEIKVLNEQKLEDNLFKPGLKLIYLKQ